MAGVLQCLFSLTDSTPFTQEVRCDNTTNSTVATANDTTSTNTSSSMSKFTTNNITGNCSTIIHIEECLPFRSIQISYFVGGPIILLLVVAVVILSVLLCGVKFHGKKRQRRKRPNQNITEEGLSTNENSQSAAYAMEDSFESVDAVEDVGTLDTVVNNKYDTIELKKLSTSESGEKNEAVFQVPSTKKRNKKKAKKSIPEGDKKRNLEYNKLVHGRDSKNVVDIDKDSYSILDKPKKVVQEAAEVNNKVKELPLPPPQKKDTSKPPTLEIKNQVPRVDAYEDVPIVFGVAKKEASDDGDQAKTEKVYYNESAAVISKLVETTESGQNETEERRLNIYTHSISL